MRQSKLKRGLALRTLPAKLKKLVLDFIYPENLYCACCGDCIEAKTRIHGLCDKCAAEINWIKYNPFSSSMDDFSFDNLYTCCIYGYFPRQIIHKYKLGGCRYLAKPLARLMAERIMEEFNSPSSIYDSISFIPCTKEKLAKRGFNQTELLAKEISKLLDIPVDSFLTKPTETPSMRMSSGFERRTMLEGVFEINPKEKSPEGLNILLVDDVLTTGSTASEAARMLKLNGAKIIDVLVFASGNGNV